MDLKDKIVPRREIVSLNDRLLSPDISIEDLERRLEMEELGTRGSPWTKIVCNCDCDHSCGADW